MSEVFNAMILDSRHKPILTMLEEIREMIMVRLQKKRDEIKKQPSHICPRIQTKLDKSTNMTRGWEAIWASGVEFGVKFGNTKVKFVINLQQRTCLCRG